MFGGTITASVVLGRRAFVLARAVIALGIGLAAACLDSGANRLTSAVGPSSGIVVPTGHASRPSVGAVLHVHGWTNHGASEFPASIAWQTAQAEAAGAGIIWWTDHGDFYPHHYPDFVVRPTPPVYLGGRLWSVGIWGVDSSGRAFILSSAGTLSEITTNGSQISVRLPPGDMRVVDTVTVFFGRFTANVVERAPLGQLARPLIGDPRFRTTVWRDESSGEYPLLDLVVPLAWHPNLDTGFREVLAYHFRSGLAAGPVMTGDTVYYGSAWPDSDSATVAISPKADAAIFPNGIDNTTDSYRLTFTATRSLSGRVIRFTLPVVTNHDSTAEVQMPPAIATAQASASFYGIRAIWGMEMAGNDPAFTSTSWGSVFGGGRHLVVYLPRDVDPTFVNTQSSAQAAVLTAAVAAQGGVTSIAHPLGTSVAIPTNTFQLNRARVDSIGAFLVQHSGWGANLIEVGYPARGEAGIREHMFLYDYLVASGVALCPVGVSDSHGQRLLADPTQSDEQDNFITWLGGVSGGSPISDLLLAMRTCQTSFGNPYYVKGGMWVDVVGDSVGLWRIRLDAAGVTPSATYTLFDVVEDSTGVGHEPLYRKIVPVPLGTEVSVGGCQADYVRVEAWAGSRPIAFSNAVRVPGNPTFCAPATDNHLPSSNGKLATFRRGNTQPGNQTPRIRSRHQY